MAKAVITWKENLNQQLNIKNVNGQKRFNLNPTQCINIHLAARTQLVKSFLLQTIYLAFPKRHKLSYTFET